MGEFVSYLIKKGRAQKRPGRRCRDLIKEFKSHSTENGREIGCRLGFPGRDKIKEKEGRLYMAGRLPNPYFVLGTILFECEGINYAVHYTQTDTDPQ